MDRTLKGIAAGKTALAGLVAVTPATLASQKTSISLLIAEERGRAAVARTAVQEANARAATAKAVLQENNAVTASTRIIVQENNARVAVARVAAQESSARAAVARAVIAETRAKTVAEQASERAAATAARAARTAERERAKAAAAGSRSNSDSNGLGVSLPVLAGMAGAIRVLESAKTAASDLNESVQKSGQVFKSNAEGMEKWADTADRSMGFSKQAALESASTFGNLFRSMGLGLPISTMMSKKLVELAGDLASFSNTSTEDAFTALRSGLVGEIEPMRRFGVNMNQNTLKTEAFRLGLTRNTRDALEPATKAQAAYSLILQQTKIAEDRTGRFRPHQR